MNKQENLKTFSLSKYLTNLGDKVKHIISQRDMDNDYDHYKKPKSIKTDSYKTIIPQIGLNKNFDKTKPTILIMDDFVGMATLIQDELERVKCIDVKKNYNILTATGNYAAFTVKNLLKDGEPPIDIALLDITLGGVVKGQEYDGVDVAILIKKYYPNCVIRFVTGHTLNRHNPEIFQFIKKFEDFFGVKIDETHQVLYNGTNREIYKHIINKNGNRVESLGDTIQEHLDKEK